MRNFVVVDVEQRSPAWFAARVGEGRKYGLRNCETRAINAMIRECGCGVKQKYTRHELAKAFVAVRVIFIPDMSDPDVRKLVTSAALGATTAMYPTHAFPSAGIPVEEQQDDRPRSIGSGSTSAATATESAKPNSDLPPGSAPQLPGLDGL